MIQLIQNWPKIAVLLSFFCGFFACLGLLIWACGDEQESHRGFEGYEGGNSGRYHRE